MVAILDADFLPFICCYNKKESDGTIKEKSLQDCINSCNSFINDILTKTKSTHYILALTKGKCFRYIINPDYKANRKYDNLPNYLKEVKQHLIDNWGAIYNTDLEADDIVNICKKNIDNSFIVSCDKDILMLVGQHYNPRKHEWIATSSNEADYYFAKSLLIGDSIDNIKGINGIGEVKANNILGNFYSTNELIPIVFRTYIDKLGEYEGIVEFYKNYKSLRIMNNWEGFEIPKPIKYINPRDEEQYESKERLVKE